MAAFKKVCLVAPDGWTAAMAVGLQRRFPRCELTVVGTEANYPALARQANVGFVTDNLFEGLRRTDLVLISRHNTSQSWNLRETVISCEAGTTICEFGRPVTEATRLIREFNRADVHYVSVSLTGVMDSVQSDRELTLESIRGRRVGLTPASVEDLEPLSHLFDALKAQGADVVAISPQQHDRRLAELAFLPRLVMMPMIRYWSENTDVSESGGFLPSLRMLENLGEASRQQTADWAEEVFHNKGHVLLALDGYAQHLNTLRQELSNDKFGEFAAHCARQLAELKTSFSAEATSAADTEIGEPTVNSVLAMLENVWQTIGQIEQTTDNEMAMTELSEVRKLLNQTTSHLRQLSLTVANPPVVADVMASASAAVAAPRVYAPISPSAPMASGSEPISAEEAYSGAVVEDESSEYDSTVDAPRLEFSPVVAEAQPAPPPALAFDSSGGRDLWLQCGSDVQAFATAARVLADARIGVENVERQQNAAGMLVRITLREVEQALRARDLLSQAGIAVSSAAGH